MTSPATSPASSGEPTLTATGEVLVEALIMDLRMWARHRPFPDPSGTGPFPPEVHSLCERVVRVDESTSVAGLAWKRVDGLRLLYRDGGVWALWRGDGDDERFYRQEVVGAEMTLTGLWEALDARKAAEQAEAQTRHESGQPPNYSLLSDTEWALIDDIRAEATSHTFTETTAEMTSGPVPPMPDPTDDPQEFLRSASATLAYRVMRREFTVFSQTRGDNPEKRPFPSPLLPGGRPDGWQVRWHDHHPGTDPGAGRFMRRRRNGRNPRNVDACDVFVVERDGGGWGLLVHALDDNHIPFTTLYDTAAMTPTGLYRIAETIAALGPEVAGEAAGPERVLREFLISRYDLTDPTEQAAATMAALGAPVRQFPKSLHG